MVLGNRDDVKISTTCAQLVLWAIHGRKKAKKGAVEMEELFSAREVRHLLYRLRLGPRGFTQVLESVATRRQPRQPRLIPYYEQYRGYADRREGLLRFLEEVDEERDEILGSALSLARRYLHRDARIRAEIEIVLGGGADACGINRIDPRPILIDLDQFVGQRDELIKTMSHELHHKADLWSSEIRREVYWILEEGPREILHLYTLFSELVGEGMAMLLAYPSRFTRLHDAQASSMPGFYTEVEHAILESFMGMDEKKFAALYSKLYDQAGPLYMVGYDMAKTTEDHLGRDALVDSSRGIASFFEAYRKACRVAGQRPGFNQAVFKHTRYLSHYLQQL
jgi:hypothetical protein